VLASVTMKRLFLAAALGYAALGLLTRIQEAAGLRTCTCYSDCWCQKPGLGMFRWVFPRFHHEMRVEEWGRRQQDA
jgi:hypothetical protein